MIFKIALQTYKRTSLIDITDKVRECIRESGITEGLATVYSPHTTAAVTINENADPDVASDLIKALNAAVPAVDFDHMEGNSDAHFKTTIVGASQTIPVEGGEPVLGRWQDIYFCEFDGPRNRKCYVQIIGK